MKELLFLVVGKNQQILKVLERVIKSNENWNALITNDIEDFFGLLEENNVNVVLLSCGLEKKVEEEIKKFVHKNKPHTKVIEHYGGGSGLLKNEVLIEFPNLNC
jgi:DNA-binding NtrC family response regulator